VPLARRAVERVTAAMLHMDDSSGIIGDDLRMLTALYARACRAAPPDPKQLAAWLVTSWLDGPGWPDIELADFADALGQTGLNEVARLVTERRTAADPDSWAAIGIKFLRQQLAALSGDVDARVAVLAENLHGARQYGEIVIPSWAVIGTADHVIPPAELTFMAHRAGAHITDVNAGHLSLISDPSVVTRVILEAVQATG
jgi:pimeloyl-ACP methyl ester carboxylesterase